MTEHYKTFGLDINIDDSKLLNDDLKGRLKGQTWEQVEELLDELFSVD